MNELKIAGVLLLVVSITGAATVALLPGKATEQHLPAETRSPARNREFTGRAFGTTYTVRWNAELSLEKEEHLRTLIEQELRKVDERISTYRPDSELAKFNALRSTDPVELSEPTVAHFLIAEKLKSESNGAFDVSVLPLLKVWGFGPYPRRTTLPKPNEIMDAQKHLGGVDVELDRAPLTKLEKSDPEAQLDLSALGEGWALAAMKKVLQAQKVEDYYLELGGEMFACGRSAKGHAWRVGIERPEENSSELICAVELDNVGVSTSGNYRNFVEIDGKNYSHLIDPRTGRPIDHAGISVSVIHSDPVLADGWSTALMVLGPEKGYEKAIKKNIAALFIYRENGELKSKQTPGFDKYVVKDAKP